MTQVMPYFDEMNILKSDKIRRTETADKFAKAMAEFLEAQLMAILNGLFLRDMTSEEYKDELMDLYVAMAGSHDREVIQKAARFAGYVQDATERAVLGANGSEGWHEGISLGLKVKRSDVPKAAMRMLSEERAMNIALNETNWIYNYDNHKRLMETQETHTWESMRDEKVRQSHWEADGQTVPINEPFIVGGYEMMFPLDDSMGAPPSETMGCRCVEL